MNTVFTHIERVREKPHHIRQQIAFTIAIGLTVLVGLVWLVGNAATGVFALTQTSFADTGTTATHAPTAAASSGFSSLLGSVGAAFSGETSVPTHIDVVDTGRAVPSSAAPAPEKTVLPF